jgi:DNA repair exonuclease SbcCD ATPase subunit
MKINRIKINNFYSFHDVELKFDDYSGLVLIEGKNKDTGGSNGSGKSSLIEAVVWGLFGKTVRKSTEEAMINFTNKKNCTVEIIINSNIKIIRTRRPTFLEFFVGGKNFTQESVAATQEKIEQYLNTNYKLFLASMVFGQNNNLDFVSATPEEKRTIIKNFLNLDELFDKRELIKTRKAEYSTQIKSIDALIKEYTAIVNKVDSTIKEIEHGEVKFLSENRVTEEMLTKYSLGEILEVENNIKTQEEALKVIYQNIRQCEDNIILYEKRLDEAKRDKPVLCKHCGVSSKREISKQDLNTLKDKIKDLDDELGKKNANRVSMENTIVSLKALLPIRSNQYKLISDWKELHSKKDYLLKDRKTAEEKLTSLAGERVESSKKYEVMRFWEVAFSEQGLVKYIIRNIIDYFNDSCNQHLTHLTAGKYRIQFNEVLEETIYIGGKETKFSSLSGGEVKKINIAVLLGLQSLLALTDKDLSDIIFFDEIAESLDTESLHGLYILLQNLKKTKTLFIITHNNDLKNLIDAPTIITVTKKNGVSTIGNQKVKKKQNVNS